MPIQKIHIDVDPTLLLDENMYEKYMAQNISQKEPFLLVYTMNNECVPGYIKQRNNIVKAKQAL